MTNNSRENLASAVDKIYESLKWLKRSYEICVAIGVKDNYSESEYVNLKI